MEMKNKVREERLVSSFESELVVFGSLDPDPEKNYLLELIRKLWERDEIIPEPRSPLFESFPGRVLLVLGS